MKGTKRNKNTKPNKGIEPLKQEDTYNVSSSFKRISRFSHSNSETSNTEDNLSSRRINEYQYREQYDNSNRTEANLYFNRYDKLDEKIDSLTQTNTSQHDLLRKELEQKQENAISQINKQIEALKIAVDSKMGKISWGVTASIIIAIIAAFGGISYYPLLSDTKENKDEINNIKIDINSIKSEIKHAREIDSIQIESKKINVNVRK